MAKRKYSIIRFSLLQTKNKLIFPPPALCRRLLKYKIYIFYPKTITFLFSENRLNSTVHAGLRVLFERWLRDRKRKFPHQIYKKGLKIIKHITKEESLVIRKKFPKVHITIVNRQSSHKKYWCEENRAAMAYLYKLRGKR